jgi:hypothetical protein
MIGLGMLNYVTPATHHGLSLWTLPRKVVNQYNGSLLQPVQKYCLLLFVPWLPYRPDYNVGIARWTNTSWCYPDTKKLCLVLSLSVHSMPKSVSITRPKFCVKEASSIFCSNGWIGPTTDKLKRTSANKDPLLISHPPWTLPTSTSHCLCK